MNNIDPDITLKTIFSNDSIYFHYINFLQTINKEEMERYQ